VPQAILSRVSPRRSRPPVAGNLLLVAILVAHTLDHALRQEATVPVAVSVVGLAGLTVGGLGLSRLRDAE